MCWSGEASAVLATVGISTSLYIAYKGEDKAIYLPLLYFSLMEALQAYTYTVINQCWLPANQIASYLGFLHIAFQPFFINAISMYFIPAAVRERIYLLVYGLCFVASIFLLIELYPFYWSVACPECMQNFCSFSGNWHIAWNFPLNDIGNYFFHKLPYVYLSGSYLTYILVGFVLPLLYGSWRCTLYHFLIGPVLATLLTNNEAERPAVWCLLSIGILMIAVKTPLRKYFYVKNYWFLKKDKAKP